MKTILALSQRERADLFVGAAQQLGLGSDVIVEKDFWVSWTLGQLFNGIPDIGGHLVFKGGTSLSKVYRVINRFSEDVDITIGRELFGMAGDDHDPEKAPNPSQRKKRTEKLVEACGQWILGDLKRLLEKRTQDAIGDSGWRYSMDPEDDTNLTLLFEYPSVLRPASGEEYVRRTVRLEFGGKADLWPVTPATITPYVAEAFPSITDAAVHVRALALQRTFWEKATILHSEAHRPAEKPPKRSLARHYADTAAISDRAEVKQALADRELRTRVVAFKEAFFANSWSNYATAGPGTFRLLPAPSHLALLEADYQRMRREMYFGPSLEWATVLERLRELNAEIDRAPR